MHSSSSSLKRSLTRQLATALAVMGTFGTVGAYVIGDHYVTQAYDRDLGNDLITLTSHVEQDGQRWTIDFPSAAQRWLLSNEGEDVIYRVVDLRRHATLVSHGELPSLAPRLMRPMHGEFKTEVLHGHPFRIGAITLPLAAAEPSVLIEVGETLGRRERLAERIMVGMLLLFLSIIAVATLMVWRGLHHALMPLDILEQQVARRSAYDLTPLEPAIAPIEVRGLLLAVNQMMARLAHSMASQNRFIANVAHQLRTPVAGIRLHAQLGLEANVGALNEEYFAEIDAGAKRLSHVIAQLLMLARAESCVPLPIEAVDLIAVVRTVVEARLPDALEKCIELGFEGPAVCSRIQGNSVLLEELLSNLVDNAIRYGKKDGTATVSIEDLPNSIVLRVKDDGPGMACVDDLFLRFRRGDVNSQTGAGLGLAIVKEIADAHGAALACVAAIDHGVDMAVTFPKL